MTAQKNTRAVIIKRSSQVLFRRTKNSYKQAGEQNFTERTTKLFLGGALIVLKVRECEFLGKNARKEKTCFFSYPREENRRKPSD